MHPRNIYKTPPDYSALAVKYPEFLKISTVDLNGTVRIDFQDDKTLRVLTKCLLHSDFNLEVDIPPDRLVPTVPLRLNYLLWLEDIVLSEGLTADITGIDIGTGACCVYPLLAARKFCWKMLATETDAESYKWALGNVQKNNLADRISVIQTKVDSSLLLHCFQEYGGPARSAHFCMCNPPFYSSVDDMDNARSPTRPPPRNARTGTLQEIITKGGEIAFVTKLIQESATLKQKIRVYTTMLGCKSSVKPLLKQLADLKVPHYMESKFIQGRTTRWALAWTFGEPFQLKKESPSKKDKNKCLSFVVPPIEGMNYTVKDISLKVLQILRKLDIKCKVYQLKDVICTMEMRADKNTWSNQRRKRRMVKFKCLNEEQNSEMTVEEEKSSNLEKEKLENQLNVKEKCSDFEIDGNRESGIFQKEDQSSQSTQEKEGRNFNIKNKKASLREERSSNLEMENFDATVCVIDSGGKRKCDENKECNEKVKQIKKSCEMEVDNLILNKGSESKHSNANGVCSDLKNGCVDIESVNAECFSFVNCKFDLKNVHKKNITSDNMVSANGIVDSKYFCNENLKWEHFKSTNGEIVDSKVDSKHVCIPRNDSFVRINSNLECSKPMHGESVYSNLNLEHSAPNNVLSNLECSMSDKIVCSNFNSKPSFLKSNLSIISNSNLECTTINNNQAASDFIERNSVISITSNSNLELRSVDNNQTYSNLDGEPSANSITLNSNVEPQSIGNIQTNSNINEEHFVDSNISNLQCSTADDQNDTNSKRECSKLLNDDEIHLKAALCVRKNIDYIVLEVGYMSGIGGRDSVHQVVQYIKNNWK